MPKSAKKRKDKAADFSVPNLCSDILVYLAYSDLEVESKAQAREGQTTGVQCNRYFIQSALHIFPEIRIDAIRFLDLLLEHIPQAVIVGWNEDNNGHGARILEGYLGVLNAGTKYGETDGPLKATSTASVVLTPASKLTVLHSLSTFLQVSLSSFAGPSSSSRTSFDPSTSLPTWYLASSFSREADYLAFEDLINPSAPSPLRRRKWQEEVDPEEGDDNFPCNASAAGPLLGEPFSLQELGDISNVIGASEFDNADQPDTSFVAHLARTLHSTLISTFLDCAPAVFSPSASPTETQLQLVLSVVQIVQSLYGVIVQAPSSPKGNRSTALEDLGAILGYMTPYFPFQPSGTRDIKVEQSFQELNLIFCELASLLVLTTNAESARATRRGNGRQQGSKAAAGGTDGGAKALSIQTQRVSDYILQLLRGEPSSGSQLGRTLTPSAYAGLLPAIWALLNMSSSGTLAQHQEIASAVLHATVEHSIKTSSKSALKKPTIEFVARLVLLSTEPRYHGSFRLGRDQDEDQKLEEWVAHLPQPLWELGANNLAASEIIIRFLLRVLQRRSRVVHVPKTIAALRSKLVPYFSMTHAVRGQLLGPYSKLPAASPLRRLALDLVATLVSGFGTAEDGLCTAVELAVVGTGEQGYWTQVREKTCY
ncbi:hypothetical protein DXG03_007093 [Asterophora parasitica]|uniref:Pre-rRNA-processing protein Ipi1 N-terminal domain-containing protein n=1 Tax=Asterophora parasitica TaxID=117018 RepID=A0A9P7KF03_9AGAR|nr:hypothetical protein DXG03_007093 [Asterophora parasitica]